MQVLRHDVGSNLPTYRRC